MLRLILVIVTLGLPSLKGEECKTYFHVANTIGPSEAAWNSTTENMRKWWADEGQKKYGSLCYATTPPDADYVIFWGADRWTHTYTYQVPKTSTSTTTGSVGSTAVYGQTTTQSTETQTGQAERLRISVSVHAVDRGHIGPPLFQDDRVGRFRWSAPDRNALEDALKAIAKGLEGATPQTGLATR